MKYIFKCLGFWLSKITYSLFTWSKQKCLF